MKVSRNLLVWGALVTCAIIIFGAMLWLTRGVLDSEKERAAAEARADLEERTRLALWRMDAAGAAMVAAESRHAPEFHSNGVFVTEEPAVKLRFVLRDREFDAAGEAAPLEDLRRVLGQHPSGDDWSILWEAAEAGESAWNLAPEDARRQQRENTALRQSVGASQARQEAQYQFISNQVEQFQRAKVIEETVNFAAAGAPASGDTALSVPMRPVWIGGELFLLRHMELGIQRGVQGTWVDVPFLKQRLLAEVKDLLPEADLRASVTVADVSPDPLALASLPFRLLRHEGYQAAAPSLNRPLVIGWVAVLIGFLTASLLVQGVMRLSERRASFVSAVTHELRTPLTTFRLYADMLESGAVPEEKRDEYLRVLSREADRLGHLVENVLAFSRIERGSARAIVREVSAAALLAPMRERFEARLAAAGLSLSMDLTTPAAERSCRVDIGAVEHILFNLVDNAAKHAVGARPAEVRIAVEPTSAGLEITFRDHGPGISEAERRRIFRPFHKSARDAAASRPGVGLGLALSRRLARSIGGRLEYLAVESGACFSLRLPKARALHAD